MSNNTSNTLYNENNTCTTVPKTVTFTQNGEVYTGVSCDLVGTFLNLDSLVDNNGVCESGFFGQSSILGIAVGVSVGGVVMIVTGIITCVILRKKRRAA